MCEHYTETARGVPYEVKCEYKEMEFSIRTIISGYALAEILMPALWKVNELAWRAQADTDGLVTVVGVLRYKDEEGQLPESLEVVVEAGYLDEVPRDPFGAGGLSYKVVDDDFVLYSWGVDMDDDGGTEGKRTWDEEGDAVFWPVEVANKSRTSGSD